MVYVLLLLVAKRDKQEIGEVPSQSVKMKVDSSEKLPSSKIRRNSVPLGLSP